MTCSLLKRLNHSLFTFLNREQKCQKEQLVSYFFSSFHFECLTKLIKIIIVTREDGQKNREKEREREREREENGDSIFANLETKADNKKLFNTYPICASDHDNTN
mgnify:FL=1